MVDVLLAKMTPCFDNGKAAIGKGCKNGIGFGTTEFYVGKTKAGVRNQLNPTFLRVMRSDVATIKMTGEFIW